MATRIVLVSLFLSLLVACDKKEDDINPGKDYSGALTLTYSRSFPTFRSLITIGVDINANGEVTMSNPPQVEYDGLAQKMVEGERLKIREQGNISITSITGKWIKAEGKEYLDVSLQCQLNGTQTIWRYDLNQWVLETETPYTLCNPINCPMRFRIESALMSEAVCGGSCSDCWGYNCFRWNLVLTPSE